MTSSSDSKLQTVQHVEEKEVSMTTVHLTALNVDASTSAPLQGVEQPPPVEKDRPPRNTSDMNQGVAGSK